ncbi:MAG: hypothetical protein ACHQZS_01355 [Candidatus Binatales bacterium]
MTRRDFFLRAIAIAAAMGCRAILSTRAFGEATHRPARRDPALPRVPWEKGRYLADLMLHCPRFPLA